MDALHGHNVCTCTKGVAKDSVFHGSEKPGFLKKPNPLGFSELISVFFQCSTIIICFACRYMVKRDFDNLEQNPDNYCCHS